MSPLNPFKAGLLEKRSGKKMNEDILERHATGEIRRLIDADPNNGTKANQIIRAAAAEGRVATAQEILAALQAKPDKAA